MLRFVGAAGEAVEDGAIGDAFVGEHAERVGPRVAGVDHSALPSRFASWIWKRNATSCSSRGECS